MVAEVPYSLLMKAKENGNVQGVNVGQNKIDVSHLQFVDDTIIFSPTRVENIQNIRRILDRFVVMFGLTINYSKSAIIPIGCEEAWATEMARILRCKVMRLPVSYLDIPLGANLRKVATWKPMIEKIEKRLAVWKARTFSRTGKLVLIKSVLNNLLIYYLGLFKIPLAVVKKIISIQRNFFWFEMQDKRAIPLVAWETIQKPKHLGGLGVGNLVVKNTALLFKWWWHFLDGNDSLWKRVIVSNHYRTIDLRALDIEEGDRGGL